MYINKQIHKILMCLLVYNDSIL